VHGEQYWFLGSSHAFEVRLPPLPQAIGMNLRDAWQQGRDAKQWRKLLNEAQMLWFSHQVNLVREQVGDLPINGLWLMQGRWWQRLFLAISRFVKR
jgi:hypothetical protein